MRKLASVQRITDINPIPDADAIEVASVLGWKVVVRKNEFKANDLILYLEIDSVPPDNDYFNFLWAKALRDKTNSVVGKLNIPRPDNYRLKTVRLRGQLSQGLIVPIPKEVPENLIVEDTDLTEFLGVTKYEPPQSFSGGQQEGSFPTSLIPKTDETRIQSASKVLQELAGKEVVYTLKYDGTSATYLYNKLEDKFEVCSRNFKIKPDEVSEGTDVRFGTNVYWNIAKKYNLQDLLSSDKYKRFAIQGEIFGPSIQKNPLAIKEVSFVVFNIYDLDKNEYLNYFDMTDLCQNMGLPFVEPLAIRKEFSISTVDEMLQDAESVFKSYNQGNYKGTKNPLEGIVIRPYKENIYSNVLKGRLSFKVINNEYLLKEKD